MGANEKELIDFIHSEVEYKYLKTNRSIYIWSNEYE